MRHVKKLYVTNKSGVAGVSYNRHQQRWMAYLDRGGRRVFQRSFRTKEEAIDARFLQIKQWEEENAP